MVFLGVLCLLLQLSLKISSSTLLLANFFFVPFHLRPMGRQRNGGNWNFSDRREVHGFSFGNVHLLSIWFLCLLSYVSLKNLFSFWVLILLGKNFVFVRVVCSLTLVMMGCIKKDGVKIVRVGFFLYAWKKKCIFFEYPL